MRTLGANSPRTPGVRKTLSWLSLPHFTVCCNQQAQPHLPKLPGLPSVWDYSEARERVNIDQNNATYCENGSYIDPNKLGSFFESDCVQGDSIP
jgi:hypothetical protein